MGGSYPNWPFGYVPSAAQWQQEWGSKQDYPAPVPLSGVVRLAPVLVDFNSTNTDTMIQIVLPGGYTRYLVDSVAISAANHTLVTATAGLFTQAAGAGVAIVTGASAVTVSATAENTNNNTMAFTINDANTQTYNVPILYFRIGTAEGSVATATVTIYIRPIS